VGWHPHYPRTTGLGICIHIVSTVVEYSFLYPVTLRTGDLRWI
jgi:hypothetical protein